MSEPPLIGRDVELADLTRQWHRVREHGPAMVLVTGPPGVGRSALLDRFAHGATDDGEMVRRASGVAWESERPGGLLHQLVGTDVPDDPLTGAARLAEQLRGEGGAGGATDRGTLVLVDDAHLGDMLSLQSLVSLVRHHDDLPVLVALSAPTGTGHGASAAVGDLLLTSPDHRIALGPLDLSEIAAVAAARDVALAPWAAERLLHHTGGMPAAVVALVEELPAQRWRDAHLALPAPSPVAAWVAERLTTLDPDVRRLVEAACVLRDVHSLTVAAAVAGPAEVWPVVDAAVASGLVRLSGPHGALELTPVDPMVAAAVLDEIGPAHTAALHRRAARVVDDRFAALRHRVAAAALPDHALAEELAEFAEERATQGAWADAADLFIDASRLTEDRLEREARLTRAVDALVGAGRGRTAAALIPEIESLRETPLRNAVLGYLAILRGRADEAEARLGRAWQLVNVDRDPEVAALICQRYVLDALSRCRWEELVDWADRALTLVPADHPAATEAAAIRGLGMVGLGRPEQAAASYEELSGRVHRGAQRQRVRLGAGWLHLAVDDLDQARFELESAVPTDHLGGSVRISLWARGWLARAHFLTGEWDQALRVVAEAREPLLASDIVLARPLLAWTAVEIHALRGEEDAARQALADAEAAPQDYEVMRIPTALARAALAESQSDFDGVVQALRPLMVRGAVDPAVEPGYWPFAGLLASALVAQGRLDEADAVLRSHEARAAQRHHRSTTARLSRARGIWYAALGDLDAARTCFEDSLRALAGLPLRLDVARTNFAYGQVLRRAGKRREADGLISTARDQYAGLGATAYVARCDRELRAGGVHLERGERGPSDLTPQEQAVVDLVARGLSNREAAAELYLSTKTIQYHLTRIYAKLGVRSRTELAARHQPSSGDDPA